MSYPFHTKDSTTRFRQNAPILQLTPDAHIREFVRQWPTVPFLERLTEVLKCSKFLPLKPWPSVTVSPHLLSALPLSKCPSVYVSVYVDQ